ncbi:hypothetical protein BS50DRAFT_17078 [Corynespora cassiicola Philippines]|uniref:Cora-domain-containing protein n=1 Tax=Corynespora cassiicola Philippines TaxID=1448308 RepID=A0A2T2P9Z3_CORCC|nr:hypothetical protein BS50DRAFT_17078 [Corynespora cassiicola Philippines]
MKPLSGPHSWVIRQTGIYHKFEKSPKRSTIILISPSPSNVAVRKIKEKLSNALGRDQIVSNPILVHGLMITSYISNWRGYCGHIESSLEEISGKVDTAELGSTLDINYATLRTVNRLKKKFLPLRSIFASSTNIIHILQSLDVFTVAEDCDAAICSLFINLSNEIMAHAENTSYLIEFADRTRMQISDTLNLMNQKVAKEQSHQVFKLTESSAGDSAAIRTITNLTLIYLPFSFIATIMGMSFFEMDTKSQKIVVSHQLWIYICLSIPLTATTIIISRLITRKITSDMGVSRPKDSLTSSESIV